MANSSFEANLKKGFGIVMVLMFVVFFCYNFFYLWYKAYKEFIRSNYHGVITEIKYVQGKRDLPDIMINGEWKFVNQNEAKVKHHIQVGDSITKESGTEIIKVYRKNQDGTWFSKAF